jgi:hypothetical protein
LIFRLLKIHFCSHSFWDRAPSFRGIGRRKED